MYAPWLKYNTNVGMSHGVKCLLFWWVYVDHSFPALTRWIQSWMAISYWSQETDSISRKTPYHEFPLNIEGAKSGCWNALATNPVTSRLCEILWLYLIFDIVSAPRWRNWLQSQGLTFNGVIGQHCLIMNYLRNTSYQRGVHLSANPSDEPVQRTCLFQSLPY